MRTYDRLFSERSPFNCFRKGTSIDLMCSHCSNRLESVLCFSHLNEIQERQELLCSAQKLHSDRLYRANLVWLGVNGVVDAITLYIPKMHYTLMLSSDGRILSKSSNSACGSSSCRRRIILLRFSWATIEQISEYTSS